MDNKPSKLSSSFKPPVWLVLLCSVSGLALTFAGAYVFVKYHNIQDGRFIAMVLLLIGASVISTIASRTHAFAQIRKFELMQARQQQMMGETLLAPDPIVSLSAEQMNQISSEFRCLFAIMTIYTCAIIIVIYYACWFALQLVPQFQEDIARSNKWSMKTSESLAKYAKSNMEFTKSNLEIENKLIKLLAKTTKQDETPVNDEKNADDERQK